MEIKDRISKFIQYKNITIAEFERNVSLANGYIKKFKGSIGSDKLNNIISYYPDININWLITGEGSMLKSEISNMLAESPIEYGKKQTRPRIPYTAAAGSLTSAVEGITANQCEQIPRINAFPDYDFTIIIKGSSMEPKYEGGDEVACKRIDNTSFIQWGKVHVLDTAQGIIIKRIYEDGEKIRCTSYNPEYPDFSIQKEEIFSMSLVVGLIRL
ncbi:S24 family peptidase [Bacteroides salyersiae]|nr:S24 family peptidase [Bacteroides salyersiae]